MKITEDDRLLIVAPHPDDESIGCGGLICKYGPQCDILLLTDGRRGYDSKYKIDEDELAVERAHELKDVAMEAHVRDVFMLNVKDGTLKENKKIVTRFSLSGYSKIFLPNHLERHKDHSVVLEIFLAMKKKQKSAASIYEYEVWSPLIAPSDVLDISDVIDAKLSLVSKYKTQIKFLNYVDMTRALNRYRGAGYKVEYAETFSKVERVSNIKKIYHKVPAGVRRFFRNIWKLTKH